MTREKLNEVLMLHNKWLNGEEDGVKANLSGADLERADLERSDLERANLSGSNLSGAKGVYTFMEYDTSKRTVYCIKHDNTWMIKAGCFWGSLDELEAKVKATHNSKVYLANIEILKGLD